MSRRNISTFQTKLPHDDHTGLMCLVFKTLVVSATVGRFRRYIFAGLALGLAGLAGLAGDILIISLRHIRVNQTYNLLVCCLMHEKRS